MIYKTNVPEFKTELEEQHDQCARKHINEKAVVEQNRALRGEIARPMGKGSRQDGKNSGEMIRKVKRKVSEWRGSVNEMKAKGGSRLLRRGGRLE